MGDNEKELTPQEIAEQQRIAKEKAIEEVVTPALDGAVDAVAKNGLQTALDQIDQSQTEQQIHDTYDPILKEYGDMVGTLNAERQKAEAKNRISNRRSRAMAGLAGVADAVSALANLVGVGGINGKHSSNIEAPGSMTTLQKNFDLARKEREANIQSISDRLDRMRAQHDAMRMKKGEALTDYFARKEAEATRSAEAAAARAHDKELLDIRIKADKEKQETQNKFTAEQNRLTRQHQASEGEKDRKSRETMNDADNAAREAAEQARLSAKPEYRRQKVSENLVGIRDELARDMGYADYNEYLRYQNVSGWGTDIGDQRNKASKRIRDDRAAQFPETEELLTKLANPEMLTDQDIDMLVGASKTFAEAVSNARDNAGGKVAPEDDDEDFSIYKVGAGR